MCSASLTHLNLLDFITIIIFGEVSTVYCKKSQEKEPCSCKVKLYPLHAMEAHGVRGGIAPTHT
jgi:hypothetical protein